jgi:hypothetical protein
MTALVYPYPTQISQEIPATEWFCNLDVAEPAPRSFRISDPDREGKDCEWTAPEGAPILDPTKLHPRYLAYYYFGISIRTEIDPLNPYGNNNWSEETIAEIDPDNPTKPMNFRVKP